MNLVQKHYVILRNFPKTAINFRKTAIFEIPLPPGEITDRNKNHTGVNNYHRTQNRGGVLGVAPPCADPTALQDRGCPKINENQRFRTVLALGQTVFALHPPPCWSYLPGHPAETSTNMFALIMYSGRCGRSTLQVVINDFLRILVPVGPKTPPGSKIAIFAYFWVLENP